jgi:uncharacterized protein (TIGR02099 family)
VAVLLVLAALLVTALRIAIVYLPRNADTLRAWVEQQTHMRIEYARLDARLRWYGPEVVLHRPRVLAEDGSQVMFEAREGSVGLDLFNFFRTGQFVAGRVAIDRPKVTLVRLADGRIRLLGLAERPADRPPFDFDRLPAGRVVVTDAVVVFRDLKTGKPPLELRELEGVLRRDRDYQRLEGRARLPETLGSRIEFDLRLRGPLDTLQDVEARADVKAESLRLAGLADFLPATLARPLSGRGPVRAVLAVERGRLGNARLQFELRNARFTVPARNVPAVEAVAVTEPRLELTPGNVLRHPTVTKAMVQRAGAPLPAEVRFESLEGDVRLRRDGPRWEFRLQGLQATAAGDRTAEPANITGTWWGRPVSRFGLQVEATHVDLGRLWPLALVFAPPSFDRFAGLAPRGRIDSLRATAGRELAGRAPTFTVDAGVTGLGVAAHARLPGVAGITARVTGDDQKGTLQLRAADASFDWPRLFTSPIEILRADADVAWRRDGADWVLSTRGARLEHAQARATTDAELRVPRPPASPVLVLDATVDEADVAAASRFIPYGRLRERTIAWLDRAFVRGKVVDGRLTYRGPVRKFPFRKGEGEFKATARALGVTLDYFPGFAPLTDGNGTVSFHNAAIGAELESGAIGGLRLGRVKFDMADYKAPVMRIDATGAGDLSKALAFVQASPFGPRIGDVFMGLRGGGPIRYDVNLLLPAMSDETAREAGIELPARDYFIRARLDGVEIVTTVLRAPAQGVTGTFELRNEQITVPEARGRILDGPFELRATPGRPTRQAPVSLDLTARGRAGGAPLPAFIGLPASIRMSGATDWELRGRIEKRAVGEWPMVFDVTSNLAGLQMQAPRPFAKEPAETRPTRVRLEFPGRRVNDIAIESGSARARLRFATVDGQWRLERGTARFDGQPAVLAAQPGLLVAGDWPEFDLGEWLAVGTGTGGSPAAAPRSGQRLMDWLGPVNVHLDRATVYGFRFDDVVAQLRARGDAWTVDVSGPDAEGTVTIPDDLTRGRPIVLDMRRLHLASETPAGDAKAAAVEPMADTDPRTLPAITARADDFAWQARRFGRLDAVIARDARGLRFDTLETSAPSFTVKGSGSWFMEAGGVRTRLAAELASTDFGATISALGYRGAVDAKKAHIKGDLWWPGGPSGDVIGRLNGTLRLSLEDGQLRDVEPGAGRMLGLLSVAQIPRRLALDFRDVTDEGLAFNTVKGDFDVRSGNAYTQNLLLKGPAVNVGIVGRTGLAAEDYDQTMVVSGNTSGPLAVAGALAAGPVVAAGVLVLSQLFKDQLEGLARVYYQVRGPWSAPVVQRIAAPPTQGQTQNQASVVQDARSTGSSP